MNRYEGTELHCRSADALCELAELFKPGYKFTFIARKPNNPEGWVFVSDDEPADVIECIRNGALEKAADQREGSDVSGITDEHLTGNLKKGELPE